MKTVARPFLDLRPPSMMFDVSTSSPDRSSTTSELTLSSSSDPLDFFFFFFLSLPSTLAFLATGSSSSESSSSESSSSICGAFFSSSSSEESSRLSSSVGLVGVGRTGVSVRSRAKKKAAPRIWRADGRPHGAMTEVVEDPSKGTDQTCSLELRDLTPSACSVLDARLASGNAVAADGYFESQFVFAIIQLRAKLLPSACRQRWSVAPHDGEG